MPQRTVNLSLAQCLQRLPTFSALRHRNYRLWFFGQTISLMGTWMQIVAQGWLVYALTGSKLALGAISFFGNLPALFLMLPAGALADRISRRTLLLVAQTVMTIQAFVLAVLTATGALRVWHIALLAIVLGIANSFDAPTRQAMTVDMVDDRRDLPNAVALNSSIFNMARVVGPAVGGVILASLGAAWCFALNGVTFFAVIIALWLMRLPHVKPTQHSEPLIAQIKVGLGYIRDHVWIMAIIAWIGVACLFGLSYSVLMPAYAADVLHVGETGLGMLNAAAGLGALAGSLLVASLGSFPHKGWLLMAGGVLFPATILLFTTSRSLLFSSACLVVIGLAFVITSATSNTLIQSLVPDALRGRVMAVFTLAFFGTMPFSSLLAGVLAQAFGAVASVTIGAVITLSFALFVFFAVPSLRRLTPAA
ncbi:MAG: MFS transporter [Anaerolineae bacterium]